MTEDHQSPYQIAWLAKPYILYAHLNRRFQNIEEAASFNSHMLEVLHSLNTKVDLIMDLREVQMKGATSISSLRESGSYREAPNLRMFVMVSNADQILSFVTSTVIQLAGKSPINFATLDNAINYLLKLHPELDSKQLDHRVLVNYQPDE